MVEVAAVRGEVAARVPADPVPESDRVGELAGGEAPQFGDVEQVAGRIGEQPVEQGARLGGQFPDRLGRDVRGPVGEHTGGVREAEQ